MKPSTAAELMKLLLLPRQEAFQGESCAWPSAHISYLNACWTADTACLPAGSTRPCPLL